MDEKIHRLFRNPRQGNPIYVPFGFQENGASKPEKNSFHNANCFGRQNHNDEYEKFTSPNSSKCNNFSGKGEDRKIYVRGISSQVTKDQQFSNTIEGEIYTDPIIVLFECCPNSETIQSLPFSFGQLRQIVKIITNKLDRKRVANSLNCKLVKAENSMCYILWILGNYWNELTKTNQTKWSLEINWTVIKFEEFMNDSPKN
ncbi:hypothetical protein F8M41_001767 [Gigaspora margarita]|uniref:Uncharacterized protein n=1 Tax=Gigaspora margarita TaxID=4874 RepID=A0A8H3XGD6_GIGMA|nr:hypothetical protein F8M41_001767 [Gigaspora margarita]